MGNADGIALINLDDGNAWVFQYFPSQVDTEDQANWEPQDTSIGIKPLMYANREAQRIEINEVWLDSTETGESLTQDIEELRALMKEGDQKVPPTLRLICGDWRKRVVLERLRVERKFFDRDGRPLRARISMTFVELIQVERTTVNTSEPSDFDIF